MKTKVLMILIVLFSLGSLIAAELPSHPLTFQNWKRLQIHESTQEVVKLSKHIEGIVSLQNSPEHSSEENQSQLLKKLNAKQNEQKTKLESLQHSKQLNFEDYFDVYLSKYSGDQKAIEYIAKRLSKDSVTYLLKRSIEKNEEVETVISSKVKKEASSRN